MIRAIKSALKHSYAARAISSNHLHTFLFFLGLTGADNGHSCRFRLGDLSFYARPADWLAVEEVAYAREYEFLRVLLPGDAAPVVLDLGANIGMFTVFVLSLWPKATVHSVEPSSGTYAMLKRNSQANPGKEWATYWAAAWKEDGEVRFENREASTSSRVGEESGDERVPAMSLATLLRQHVKSQVDILKLDIEGAEEAVLCGHEQLLETVDNVVIEVHPQLCNLDRVVASLREVYQFLYKVPGRKSSKPLLLASHRRHDLPFYPPS